MSEISPMNAPRPGFVNGPYTKRGWLQHGNAPGDLSTAPRCGAKTRRGTPCQAPAMANGRCRMHGGLSTGPKTPEGLERSRKARWKHGRYSAKAKRLRHRSRARLKWTKEFLAVLGSYDSMLGLLVEIEDQMARGDPRGLAQKCARALQMWDRYEAVIAASACLNDEGEANPHTRCRVSSAPVRAMLETGPFALRLLTRTGARPQSLGLAARG